MFMRAFHVSLNTSNEIIEHEFRRQVPKVQLRSLKGNTSPESAESSRYGGRSWVRSSGSLHRPIINDDRGIRASRRSEQGG